MRGAYMRAVSLCLLRSNPAAPPPARPHTAQYFPGRGAEGYRVPFTRVVFIEEGDFRQQDSKDYYGLAPGKSVMLRWVWAGVRWGEGWWWGLRWGTEGHACASPLSSLRACPDSPTSPLPTHGPA